MNNPNEDILKLRRRVKDLLSLGYMTEESGGTYEQTLLQVWQEADRRRISSLQQAETLRRQAAAAEAQAGAFTMMSSILYNVVNAFVEADQKRVREEEERKAEKSAAEAIAETPAPAPARKRGRPNKS